MNCIIKKTIKYGARTFGIALEANGFYSIIIILSKVYDNTLYPLIQVFLLARLLDLLQATGTVTFIDPQWIILSYLLATIMKLLLKSFADIREVYF